VAQSPPKLGQSDSLDGYLKNWDALSSMLTRGRSFSGRERNCCFLNLGTSNGSLNRFADVSAVSGLDFIDDARAVIATDWDRDGDLDFWQTNRQGPRLRFVKNQLEEHQKTQWVAFELAGTTSNRDAIGAVLELKMGDRKIIRTLTAGDGFMSQSGKRIHFGLGKSNTSSLSANVRWPGGSEEVFSGLSPGLAYSLVQGSGEVKAIPPHPKPTDLPESPPVPFPPTEQARIILTHRIPSPSLDYVDFNGDLQRHEPDTSGQGKPTFINLWASWCPNCRKELADFKANHAKIAAKGVELLALTVDGVPQPDRQPDVSDAKILVAKSAFPFAVGATDQNSLRALTILHDQVITRQRPLPLPSSFLIDKWGRLAAIYKGPVSSQQLLSDLDLLEADATTLAGQAFPFPCRNGTHLFNLSPLGFAQAYLENGDHAAARQEAHKMINTPLTENAEADLAKRAQAWYFLGTMEQSLRNWEDAVEAYQTTLDLSPNQILLHIPLGVSQWQAGRENEARQTFKDALAKGEKNPTLLEALGKAHLQIKQYNQAISYFQEAVALAPQQANLHLNLAFAHQTRGDDARAIALYQKILAAQPNSANAKSNLALLLATTPNDSIRDGKSALKLAREILEEGQGNHPSPLDALGSALAETGDFENAIMATKKAISVARAIGRNDLLPKLQEKIKRYQSGKPYRIER